MAGVLSNAIEVDVLEHYTAVLLAAGCGKRLSELTQSRPKSFLEVMGRKIITYNLELLHRFGFRRVIIVVGYLREQFFTRIGNQYGNLAIKYLVSEDYESKEHGWSFYLTKSEWQKTKNSVLLLDPDGLYHPGILENILKAPWKSTVAVDETYRYIETEEEQVLGKEGQVTGFVRSTGNGNDAIAGGYVGVTKFSPDFMERFYRFCEAYFDKSGDSHKYERLFNQMVRIEGVALNYQDVSKFCWLNINTKKDYDLASGFAKDFYPWT